MNQSDTQSPATATTLSTDGVDSSRRARRQAKQLKKSLCTRGRFLAEFDNRGMLNLRMIEEDAIVWPVSRLDTFISDPGAMITQEQLLSIAKAAVGRLKTPGKSIF